MDHNNARIIRHPIAIDLGDVLRAMKKKGLHETTSHTKLLNSIVQFIDYASSLFYPNKVRIQSTKVNNNERNYFLIGII